MDKIKAFFNKKKLDAKFKKLGEGHKLASNEVVPNVGSYARPQVGHEHQNASYSTADTEQAAQAALRRLQISQPTKLANRSSQTIKAEAKRQIEAGRKAVQQTSSASNLASQNRTAAELDAAPLLAVSGVYFTCDLLGEDICLPKKEMQSEVESFLRQSLVDDDPVVASSVMIHSLNGSDNEKRQAGIDVLCKYLQNIIATPNDEKFRRIKKSNKIFQEKVAVLKGAVEFLNSVGFREQVEGDEAYLVLSDQTSNDEVLKELQDRLMLAMDCLKNGEPVPLRLYRNPQILPPGAQSLADLCLPADFFDRTADEIKAEQRENTEQLEKTMTLRTKEMRERDELRATYKYKYCVVRIRMPDGYCLQGTFRSAEKLSAVENFLREHMIMDQAQFILKEPFGEVLSGVKMEKTLAKLNLSPAALLHLQLDPDFSKKYLAEHRSLPDRYLK